MNQIEHRSSPLFETQATDAVKIAKEDAVRYFFAFFFGSHDNLPSIDALMRSLEFEKRIPGIERTIEHAQPLAEPEARALERRLTFVTQRRKTILQQAHEISREPPRKRVLRWGSLSPNLLDLSPELHLLPVDAEACTLFVGQLKTPEDRYSELQTIAREKLHITRSIPLEDDLQGQRRFLQHVEKGLFRPTDVTLFDLLLASERISQERMKIMKYKSS